MAGSYYGSCSHAQLRDLILSWCSQVLAALGLHMNDIVDVREEAGSTSLCPWAKSRFDCLSFAIFVLDIDNI